MEDIKTVALRIAEKMNAEGYVYLGEKGSVEFASRILAELQKDATPVAWAYEVPVWLGIDNFADRTQVSIEKPADHKSRKNIRPLYTHPQPKAATVPDVDWLAQVIRAVDGKHSLGAGALAEKIVEAMLEAAPSLPAAEDALLPIEQFFKQEDINPFAAEDARISVPTACPRAAYAVLEDIEAGVFNSYQAQWDALMSAAMSQDSKGEV